jgi:hypothetical protein
MPLDGLRTSQTRPSRSIHQATPCFCGRIRLAFGAGNVSGAPLAQAAQSARRGHD